MNLLIQKLSATAKLPKRGSSHAAGYDLYADEDAAISARGQTLVSTGIAMTIPDGHYGRVAPRSGLAAKHSIGVNAGVIDSDFRNEVKVILLNHSDTDYQVSRGDRIAQLILEKISTPDVLEVTDLQSTDRLGGFGSTGK